MVCQAFPRMRTLTRNGEVIRTAWIALTSLSGSVRVMPNNPDVTRTVPLPMTICSGAVYSR
jgi:hypothetical protein